MRVRLFQFHGSATRISTRNGVVVLDWDVVSPEGTARQFAVTPQSGELVRTFPNESAARRFVERDGSAQIGGLPGLAAKRVEALEHYRLVHVSERQSPTRQGYPWVKTFERVPGATIEGTGPPNANVTARVQMRMQNANDTFFYTTRTSTDGDGNFQLTVPYSTTGYERWGPEQGRTNVSVRATGAYSIVADRTVQNESGIYRYVGQVNVSESQVIGENDTAAQTTLELTQLISTGNESTTDSGNDSSDTSGNDGSESTGTSTPTPSGENSLRAPDAVRP